MSAGLVGVTWIDEPVGSGGEDRPTWGLALSSLGIAVALVALLASPRPRRRVRRRR